VRLSRVILTKQELLLVRAVFSLTCMS
jgi:hypothetical protein